MYVCVQVKCAEYYVIQPLCNTLAVVLQEVAVNQIYRDGFKMDQAVEGRSKTRLPPTAVLGWQALACDKTSVARLQLCVSAYTLNQGWAMI